MTSKAIIITVLVIVGLIVYNAAPVTAVTHEVHIIGTSFSPPELNIDVGDEVTWINDSLLQQTATSGFGCTPDGKFDSGLLAPLASWSFTFNAEGAFSYYSNPQCLIGMTGQINVAGPVRAKKSTWGKIKTLYNNLPDTPSK